MKRQYRTKKETIEYFKWLAYQFEIEAHRNDDKEALGKSKAYEMAAFEVEHNMK